MAPSFAVFRVAKLKTVGEIAGSASHQLRERETLNADPAKLKNNVVIVAPPAGDAIMAAIRAKLGGKEPHKNAVLASDILISASPGYFRPDDVDRAGYYQPEKLAAWRAAMEPWIAEQFPDAIAVVLHLDEATPHYTITDIPVNRKTGRLSHRDKFGSDNRRDGLSAWQTKAAEPVARLGIERGIAGSTAEHNKITQFYGALAAPVADIPRVKTAAPKPLPDASLIEQIPFTDAHAKRAAAEAARDEKQKRRNKEIAAQRAAAVKAYPVLAEKSKSVDMYRKQNEALKTTLVSKEKDLAASRLQADKLRALPLADVLLCTYGATEAKDSKPSYSSRKFNLPDGRQVAVTAEKWIEQNGKGGKGAINLVMHLDSIDYKAALRLLSDSFDSASVTAAHAQQLVARATKEIETLRAEPVAPPAPVADKWPRVSEWLSAVRGIPAKLVTRLHERGLAYADARGNAVFIRQHGGAFVRGTGTQPFKRTYGGADCGAFALPGKAAGGVYIVESALDAIAIKAMHPDAVAIATGGNLLSVSRVLELLQDPALAGAPVFAAHDNDERGEALALDASRALGATRYAPPQGCKDWSEAVKRNPALIAAPWSENSATGLKTATTAVPARVIDKKTSGPRF